jgi:PAS domain S-box-containing protein
MKDIKSTNKKYFYDYYEKGDDTKRLTIILLLFAFVLCPFFAFFFKFLGAPISFFYATLSATFVFPLILFIEKIFPFFKGKLPYLYFIYFNGITVYVIYQLYLSDFAFFDLVFFVGLFAVLNFATQRFYLSLIYFINTFIFFSIAYSLIENKDDYNYAPIFVLVICIGVFFAVLYFSRNKMINRIQDHNTYLKRIVNNIGNGVIFFQLRSTVISIVDFNQETVNILGINEVQEIEDLLIKNIEVEDILEITELEEEIYITKEIKFSDGKILEFKIANLKLKNGNYFLATIQDITQKIEENKTIKENEKKYKNLFVRNQSPLFTLKFDGEIIESNPAFLKLFEINSNCEIKLFKDEEWIEFIELIQKKGTLTNFNKVYGEDTDKQKFLVFNFYLDFESQIIEGNILDITEITLRTKALRENENKYRVIYEESNDSIVLLDQDRIIDINQQGLKLFGKSYDFILEKSLWDFTYNQSPELKNNYDNLIKVLKEKKQVKFNWVFAKENSFIDVSISIVELNLGDDLVYQCVIRDETERNTNIRALENSKQTFESIIENTPEGFLILREDNCLFASQEFFRIFNIEQKRASEIQLNDSFFGVNLKSFKYLIEEHIADKQIKQKQFKFNIDQKDVEIDITIVSIIFEEQEASLLILKDVSYQNELSKEVLRAELAEETNKKLEKEIEERQKAEQKLASEYLRTNAIFDSSENTLMFTLDTNLKITSYNRHCKLYFDYQTKKDLAVGNLFESYFEQIISPIKMRYFRYLLSSLRKGKSHLLELKFINIYNEKKWMELYLNPIFDINGTVTEISLVTHDITFKKNYEKELITSLKEKEVLLKEVHHRVKNNLQIISSILNLQSSYIEDEKILEIIEESRHRIRSMAIIHENLYQTKNFSSINFKNYSRELVRNLISSYQFNKNLEVELVEKVELVELNLDQAIPCGLIINELITNSMKYAFPQMKKGKIYLELKEKNTNITLVVGDSGVGLPKDFNVKETETLGLQLVMTLVEQLDGNIKIETNKGIKYFITFEKQKL